MLALEDLAGKTEQEIKDHIAANYAGDKSGFEGQWEPEETELDALKRQEYWSLGGYDNSPEENRAAIKNFIGAL